MSTIKQFLDSTNTPAWKQLHAASVTGIDLFATDIQTDALHLLNAGNGLSIGRGVNFGQPVSNTIVGNQAFVNTDANNSINNTVVGTYAGSSLGGRGNVIIGKSALETAVSSPGNDSVIIGAGACTPNINVSDCVVIGADAKTGDNASHRIVLGSNVTSTTNNTIAIDPTLYTATPGLPLPMVAGVLKVEVAPGVIANLYLFQ